MQILLPKTTQTLQDLYYWTKEECKSTINAAVIIKNILKIHNFKKQLYWVDLSKRMSNSAAISAAAQQAKETAAKNNKIVVKIGMLGDVQVGKTSLMYKYVEGKFDEDYIMTLGICVYYKLWLTIIFSQGVNFLEKSLTIKNTDISLMIWDLGGQKDFMSMLDLVCNDSVALFFMFDLSRKATLHSVKEWYVKARKENKKAMAFLIGTKYDKFVELSQEEQEDITTQARKYAEKMKSPLIYCSAQAGVNVKKLFKLVLAKVFDLNPGVEKITNVGEPILEYN